MNYPLSAQGVFWTIQGEGNWRGRPEVFVRLGGCDVGCPECDTDYRVVEHADEKEIARRAAEVATPSTQWVWITGGEPLLSDLRPLIAELRRAGFRIALATSGTRKLTYYGSCFGGPEFLSVSPHAFGDRWAQRSGDQLNIVPGLNGLRLTDLTELELQGTYFGRRYITPCDGRSESLAECVEWVKKNPGWLLGEQSHKLWGLL